MTRLVKQLKDREKKYTPPEQKIHKFILGEASFADFFKRNNHELFLQKIKDGELIGADGSKFAKLSSSDELVKIWPQIKDEDSELANKVKKLIQQRFGAIGKIPKAENGFSPPSSGKPSGEDWEALIVCATKKYNNDTSWNSGPEWERIEKFWTDYEAPSMKLGKEFSDRFGSSLEQWGAKGDMATASRWRGRNKTPKTDIMAGKHKISLKKYGGSQLMSAGQDEAISTFEAAMETYSKTNKRQVMKMIDDIQSKMGQMSEKGTIGALEKKIQSGKKLTDAETKSAAELSVLNINAKELNDSLNSVFQDMRFKSHFCWEAATGNIKFEPTPDAAANVIITFKDSGSIANELKLNSPESAGKTIAQGNGFYVSFKTGGGGSRPYLALRSKKLSKRQLQTEQTTFRDIVFEELESEGITLTEEHMQLDEFSLFRKIRGKASAIAKNVASKIQRVYNAIVKRLKEAFNMIKSLGSKMLSALLKFLGLSPDVKVSGGGQFPLR